MKDTIANIAVVNQPGKHFSHDEEILIDVLLDEIISNINSCNSVQDAETQLIRLECLQSELARACFKWEIPLSRRHRRLVREFDRGDDSEVRSLVFDKIKRNDFL